MSFDKPLLIDTRYLRPLPKELFNCPCGKCDKRQAMWEMGAPGGDEQHTICSLCFLYESNWGKAREDQIHEMVVAVEAEVGDNWLRGADGKTLLVCKDANRILAAIALTSRAFQAEDKAKGAESGSQGEPSSGGG